MTAPSPEKVMQVISAGWACSILGAAARHGVFTHLEGPGDNAAGLAKKAGISPRGAQALLDGVTGLGLVNQSGVNYVNSPEASFYLVKGKPAYLGGMAEVFMDELPVWAKLGEAVRTGAPQAPNTADVVENPFWEVLVPAIAALSAPVARIAAERLGIAQAGAISWLDVGGGSGIWSATWLSANPQARGVHGLRLGEIRPRDLRPHRASGSAGRQCRHLPEIQEGAQARRDAARERFRSQRRPGRSSLRDDVLGPDAADDEGRLRLSGGRLQEVARRGGIHVGGIRADTDRGDDGPRAVGSP
jgi:hypothetical protein